MSAGQLNETHEAIEMPKYRCHKEVHALKIQLLQIDESGEGHIIPKEDRYEKFEVSAEYVKKHNPKEGGYYVVYEDGYKSFSPADAFEGGYTLIEQGEPNV